MKVMECCVKVMGWCVKVCGNGIAWEVDRTVCECNEKVCVGVRIM